MTMTSSVTAILNNTREIKSKEGQKHLGWYLSIFEKVTNPETNVTSKAWYNLALFNQTLENIADKDTKKLLDMIVKNKMTVVYKNEESIKSIGNGLLLNIGGIIISSTIDADGNNIVHFKLGKNAKVAIHDKSMVNMEEMNKRLNSVEPSHDYDPQPKQPIETKSTSKNDNDEQPENPFEDDDEDDNEDDY